MAKARALLLLLLLVVLSACRVDAEVRVTMDEDGAGSVVVTVALDPEAAARIPDLAEQLRTTDLEAAGWQVEGPSTVEGGGLELSATKSFATPEQGEAVLAEVVGASGLLTETELSRTASFGRTTSRFATTADASGGLAVLTDDELVEAVGGDGFGGQLERISEETGVAARDQVTLNVRAELPGSSRSWVVPVGGEPQTLALEDTEIRPLPLGLAAAAAICFVVGLLLLIVHLVRRLRRRPPDGEAISGGDEPVEGRPSGDDGDPAGAVAAADISWGTHETIPRDEDRPVEPPVAGPATVAGTAGGSGSRRLELVVVDVMGVVFSTGRDNVDLLTDFAHQRGGALERHAVETSWNLAAEGRLSVGELWASLGLTEDPGDLTDEYLAVHRTQAGLRSFLERMVARDLPVAGVADDVAEWSRKLRSTHKLDHLSRAWIVSGDVGERLPGGAVLGRVIQVTGIDSRNALFLSDRPAHLDTARSFGFAGALFVPPGAEVPGGVTYPTITSFDDLAP